MSRLLNKIFGSAKPEITKMQHVLPSLASIRSIHEIQERAIVGWIASRMGELLHLDKENGDLLFYLSFSQDSFDSIEGDAHYLLHLAERLFTWVKQRDNVLVKIEELHLSPPYHKCLVRVFEEFKNEWSTITSKTAGDEQSVDHAKVIWDIYRDVIYAVTQRKFLLIEKEKIQEYMIGNLLCEAVIKERPDIPKARELAKSALTQLGISQSMIMNHLLIISEAVTNILKHAEEGKMTLIEDQGVVRVIVEDKGSGFSMNDLPNTILLAGYSTKKSLGQGFTLMMKMSDQVLLSTSSSGSTIILIYNKKEGTKIDEA